MHLKAFSGWLLLAPVLGSALAAHTEQEVFAGWDSPLETPGQVPIGKPHRPQHEAPAESTGTIYQTLANDTKFTLITKAITFVEDIGALLNDSSSTVTFFAPPDAVLRPPPGSSRPPPKNLTSFDGVSFTEGDDDSLLALISQYRDLAEVAPLLEELDIAGGEDDDKRKKIFKIILRAILSYHILPGTAYGIPELTSNVTYPTQLRIPGAFGGEPLRLRVTQNVVPPAVYVNFFTKVIRDFKATNGNDSDPFILLLQLTVDTGIVYVVNHALLPPPSVFQELYLIPKVFATFTSALQRSELTDNVDLRYVHGHGLEGTPLVTVFAPTNRAFEALPKKLQIFLFSPFGARVLKKLLQFHIVPNAVIHSNYIHGEGVAEGLDVDGQPTREHLPKFPVHVKPVFSRNLTLDTLFENHTLDAHIVQNEVSFPAIPGHKKPSIISTKIFVNGGRPAIITDVVSLNGAIHVIDRLLDPRKQHHKHHHKHHRHSHHHEHPNPHFHPDHDHHRGVDLEPLFVGLNGIHNGPPDGHPGARWGHGKGPSEHGPVDHHDEHRFEGKHGGEGHKHDGPQDEHRPEGKLDRHVHGGNHDEHKREGKHDRHLFDGHRDEHRREGKYDRHLYDGPHDEHRREGRPDRRLHDGPNDEHRREGKHDVHAHDGPHDEHRRERKHDGHRREGKHDGPHEERPSGDPHGPPRHPHESFEAEARHDIWADWESWLPQWAEQD
ncbi:hypothetical protein HYPSUDRAFT_76424 [Hypholoma sublateritium FD-334 SS-4]|uniref:FAS1 domain-containing protein n=1 Tax=Hypholoma sublateritium (strain FD-334 SS-4) TaxID=945553 RepID=A0A0D2P174_HYPSF|nr:hypothetical protein HYPSUDRAFT_76424 [Hypholoma sublateritium FD-334 SS-4]